MRKLPFRGRKPTLILTVVFSMIFSWSLAILPVFADQFSNPPAFPTNGGWTNPAGQGAAFDTHHFGMCDQDPTLDPSNGLQGSFYIFQNAHLGADSQNGAVGNSVVSIGPGVVENASIDWHSLGKEVEVLSTAGDGSQFLVFYGHLNSSVYVGEELVAGTPIGKMADLKVFAPHVHLGIYPITSEDILK